MAQMETLCEYNLGIIPDELSRNHGKTVSRFDPGTCSMSGMLLTWPQCSVIRSEVCPCGPLWHDLRYVSFDFPGSTADRGWNTCLLNPNNKCRKWNRVMFDSSRKLWWSVQQYVSSRLISRKGAVCNTTKYI